MKSTITLTFGDQAENHVGMQKIGKLAIEGFNRNDLLDAKKKFEKKGYKCNIVNLSKNLPKEYAESVEKAYLLIVRDGINCLLSDFTDSGADELLKEQKTLVPDKKAFMYGRVVNKVARYNLCFDTVAQEPDYKNGKGRIVAYSTVPMLSKLRDELEKYFGKKGKGLAVEGNYYYDVKKCYIGYHGDSERVLVIGLRLGAMIPLHYQWFYKGEEVGDRLKINFKHGDLYVMSEKATGNDWKLKNVATLRHAAGTEKVLGFDKN